MVATAIEVLPLADLRQELRLGPPGDSLDAMLVSQIGAAVAYVQAVIDAPLLDRMESREVFPAADRERPIEWAAQNVRSVTQIQFWPPDTDRGRDPTGNIDVDTLGRLRAERGLIMLWPPAVPGDDDAAPRWPEVEAGTPLLVTWMAGIAAIGADELAIRQATVLLVRQLFDGRGMVLDGAIHNLLRPWMHYQGARTDP